MIKVTRILETLEKTTEKYRKATGDTDERLNYELFDCIKDFISGYSKFNEAERKISKILGLSNILDPQFATTLITNEPLVVIKLRDIVIFTLEYLPRLSALISQEYVDDISTPEDSLPKFLQGKKLLTVIILEEEERLSIPGRLIEVLDSVSLLYEVCVTMEGLPVGDLSVLACDSGSDKSFDFVGIAKAIEMVKDIILSFWDLVVFYREKKMSERLNLIAKSLPILDEIGLLLKNGRISAEQAELMRRNIVKGTNKFISAGATIPEMETKSNYSPRKLMAPEPKLLSAPAIETTESDTQKDKTKSEESRGGKLELEKLSPQDKNELLELLKKAEPESTKKDDQKEEPSEK